MSPIDRDHPEKPHMSSPTRSDHCAKPMNNSKNTTRELGYPSGIRLFSRLPIAVKPQVMPPLDRTKPAPPSAHTIQSP